MHPFSFDRPRTMPIHCKINHPVSTAAFIDLLHASGLAARRPVADRDCMEGMVKNANLTVTAWDGDRMVGVARSLTDFHYACYLSDLAVHADYQQQGIGKLLLRTTRQQVGPQCKLILIAAPAANDYYEHLGFANNPRCWVLDSDSPLTD